MKGTLLKLLISCLFLFSLSTLIPAQTSSEDFPHSLKAAEILAKLEPRKLIPRGDSEILIIGEVRISGIINYSRIRTPQKLLLLAALTIAGGLSENADKQIRVIRKDVKFGFPTDIFIDRTELRRGKQDIYLESGDIIIVPKSTKSEKQKIIRQIQPIIREIPPPVKIAPNLG